MTNKYPADCSACGSRVPANGGVLTKSGRRWDVRHTACAEGGSVTSVTTNSGYTATVNRRGMCEDAPCCGCCTGDLNIY